MMTAPTCKNDTIQQKTKSKCINYYRLKNIFIAVEVIVALKVEDRHKARFGAIYNVSQMCKRETLITYIYSLFSNSKNDGLSIRRDKRIWNIFQLIAADELDEFEAFFEQIKFERNADTAHLITLDQFRQTRLEFDRSGNTAIRASYQQIEKWIVRAIGAIIRAEGRSLTEFGFEFESYEEFYDRLNESFTRATK